MKEDLAQVVHNISDTIDGLEDVEEDQAERDMLISSLEEHLKEHHIDENVQRLKEDGLNQVVDFETGNILVGLEVTLRRTLTAPQLTFNLGVYLPCSSPGRTSRTSRSRSCLGCKSYGERQTPR